MNAAASPLPEPIRPQGSDELTALTGRPVRRLLGSVFVSAAVAAAVAIAINAAGGGSGPAATNSAAFRAGRVVTVPGSVRAGTKTATDLGALWGKAFRGDAPSYESLARAEAQANTIPLTGVVDRAANTLRLAGRNVAVTIVANPPNGRNMAFRVAGLENPTIGVSKGAHVTVTFVNADSDSAHGWLLLNPVVRVGGIYHGPHAFSGSYAPILGDPTNTGQPLETIQFVASTTGTYRYECPVPGHAAMGMQGTFKVTT